MPKNISDHNSDQQGNRQGTGIENFPAISLFNGHYRYKITQGIQNPEKGYRENFDDQGANPGNHGNQRSQAAEHLSEQAQ